MQVTLELPNDVAQQLGPEADIPRRVLEAIALEGYRAGRLSRGQISAMLGLGFTETESFLATNAAYLNCSIVDLEADRATLEKILGKP